MSNSETDPPVVLVVDDDEEVIETYELWLAEDYQLRTASDGEEALNQIDDAVDVVLLDRLMPGMSGEVVLEEIRARGIDCRVAMATAVEPDVDIADMPFDAYVTKALERENVEDTIEQLLARSEYEDASQQHYAVAEKLAILEEQKSEEELQESEEYGRLQRRLDDLDKQIDNSASSLTQHDLVSSLSQIEEETTVKINNDSSDMTPTESQYDLLGPAGEETRAVDEGTTLIVATSSPAGKQFIMESLRNGLDKDEGGLIITTDDPASTIVDSFEQMNTGIENLRIVDCQSGPAGLDEDGLLAQDIDTPRNLTDIGIGFKNAFSEFDQLNIDRGRCGLVSLSVILSYADQETVYRFCQTLARGLKQEGFIGLFLLDRNAHDEQTENTLRRAVDGMVEVRSNDTGHEYRVSGIQGLTSNWVSF